MKKILFLFLVIALASCNSVGNAPTVIDEKFDPTLDSLYIQCKDLKGIGELRIGKVTYRQVKKDKGITLSPILFDTYTNFYNGYWGESSSMELANYIEDNATKIKQFHVGKLCRTLCHMYIASYLFDLIYVISYFLICIFVKVD